MQSITARPGFTQAPRRIVILAMPIVDALDVVGPAQAFGFANREASSAGPPYHVELVSAGSERLLHSDDGIDLQARRVLDEERASGASIDTLIVTTGLNGLDEHPPPAIAWLKEVAASVRRVCSICVGAFALAEAGLLDGRRATTHWKMTDRLKRSFPDILVQSHPIWVRDGNIYTSAGACAGIDLALALIAEDLGEAFALEIARTLVVFLRRPAGQAQVSVTLQAQIPNNRGLRHLTSWIVENLAKRLTTQVLADEAAISTRSLSRLFQSELGTTPAKYVESARLEAARRALEMGMDTLEVIADRCGYRSVDVLRRALKRREGFGNRKYDGS